jgi:hypothetical protein
MGRKYKQSGVQMKTHVRPAYTMYQVIVTF